VFVCELVGCILLSVAREARRLFGQQHQQVLMLGLELCVRRSILSPIPTDRAQSWTARWPMGRHTHGPHWKCLLVPPPLLLLLPRPWPPPEAVPRQHAAHRSRAAGPPSPPAAPVPAPAPPPAAAHVVSMAHSPPAHCLSMVWVDGRRYRSVCQGGTQATNFLVLGTDERLVRHKHAIGSRRVRHCTHAHTHTHTHT
jgi:hypothetical protein